MRLVLATHNPGKLTELRALLEPLAIELVDAATIGLAVPDETGGSYVANAELKAVGAAAATGALALGDDVGLAVAALGGAPGVHTARYTERAGGVAAACAELAAQTGLRAAPMPEVRAALCCALVLAAPDGVIAIAESEIPGRLRWPPGDAPVHQHAALDEDVRRIRLEHRGEARRVLGSSRNTPSIWLVTMPTPGRWIPRVVMHSCVASMTTATPLGCRSRRR